MHDEKGNHSRQGCDFLFLFGHADGDADGKDDRQVAEDDVAGITHDGEQGMKDGPIPENVFQSIGLDGCGVCERRADTEKQTGDR